MPNFQFQTTYQDDPAISFHGDLIGSSSNAAYASGRITDIAAYRTIAGNVVVVKTASALHAAEDDRRWVYVFNDEMEIPSKLGYGRLAMDLYRDLGIQQLQVA
ncbi:hypothetical protein [Sulfitobacter sp. R18_1]|uniref:hypothetical protein n=1 Tax=Sulfitobacter sp. R18_1 TaxID=2821104 RepID=UPI001ADAC2D7|nr:hypothetical protein [Sulfitobacter sp. R18_1]MBO9428266.1 hypothetical protein [Sulfitobacter sp. R18_1]